MAVPPSTTQYRTRSSLNTYLPPNPIFLCKILVLKLAEIAQEEAEVCEQVILVVLQVTRSRGPKSLLLRQKWRLEAEEQVMDFSNVQCLVVIVLLLGE